MITEKSLKIQEKLKLSQYKNKRSKTDSTVDYP